MGEEYILPGHIRFEIRTKTNVLIVCIMEKEILHTCRLCWCFRPSICCNLFIQPRSGCLCIHEKGGETWKAISNKPYYLALHKIWSNELYKLLINKHSFIRQPAYVKYSTNLLSSKHKSSKPYFHTSRVEFPVLLFWLNKN